MIYGDDRGPWRKHKYDPGGGCALTLLAGFGTFALALYGLFEAVRHVIT
jgi:hypothetical protein